MASVTSTPSTSTGRASRTTRRSMAAVSPSGAATGTGSSPTRITRIQEKEELRQLNDRLAAYIERVRQLENEKSSMQILLEEKEESSAREVGSMRLLYETELADARKILDTTANERARLQIELSQLSEDHARLQARNNKKESELTTAVSRWRNLEAALNSKEAEFANVLAGNRSLENEISELKTQVSTLESALQDAKTQLHAEMLRRVDLENQVQTLREQMDFQRHLSEEEIREMRSRHETRLVEVDSGRQKEFESKLAEALQQLRREHEVQILQYKEELEKTFCAKLENAQQAAVEGSALVSSTMEELAGTKLRLDSLSSQLTQSQKQNSALESRLRDLEELLDRERRASQRRLTEKEQEMAEVRQKMQAQLEEYENLLDVKLALDMEINAYRKMLEGEEQRLNLSPSPSQHGAVSRTHVQAARRLRGKKRKLGSRSSGGSGYRITQHASARGSVSIDEIDPEGNYVKLRNNSEIDQPLGGWVLRKSHAAAPDVAFQVPPSYVLGGGCTVTIWGGGAGVDSNPPTDLVWKTQRNWGAMDDVRIALVNPRSEQEVAERRLTRVPGGGDGESEAELEDEEAITGSEAHLRRQPKRRKKKCCLVS
ncbi:lamin L3 isoform X2 [Paramormyrops kingsleyae]|uniref:Lamin L3 n=1 Tax=Paramormyrops kingsleyae TaxID=1676925 RepID=A0A3B3Q1Z4_9TELE|nr:lamin-L(III)-like isoform X2 [Paramormyrops kingsleyae]